jgi:inhibitor of KinA sporulation pathway (predicted exonuclease)
MSKYKDGKLICVDLESTCWKGPPPEGMVSEIIEIGYTIVDYVLNELQESGSIIIKPETSTISQFCNELTGITQEIVDRGITFKEACNTLQRDLTSGGRAWASFGNYDIKMFRDQCIRTGIEYPFTPQHLNIKTMTKVLLGQEIKGLGAALSALKMNFEGQRHSGKDDSYNTARILQQLTGQIRGNNDKKGWTIKSK